MTPDSGALRAILKQYIGPAYDRALRNTGSESRAREVTRRAMELLKRSCEAGVEPSKALVLRITDDCCNESAFYNRQAPAPMQAKAPLSQAVPASFAAETQPPAPQHIPMQTAAPIQAAPLHPVTLQAAPGPAARIRDASADAQENAPAIPLAQETYKKSGPRPKERVSPGSALLVMGLSLIVVALVVILVVMLASGDSAPAAAAGGATGFSAWFNAHIFPLF